VRLLKRALSLGRYFHIGTTLVLFVSAIAQAATFVVLARGLGRDSFGIFMVAQAFTQLGGSISGLGSGEALIRRVSCAPDSYRKALGHALVVITGSGIVLGVILWLGLLAMREPLDWVATAAFIIGELFGNRLAALAEHSFIARFQVGLANAVRIGFTSSKLAVAVVAFYGFGLSDLSSWMMIQGATVLLVGAGCLGLSAWRLGSPLLSFDRDSFRFGTLMVVTQFATSIQFSADRIVLSLVAPASVVAVYSAAAKGVQVALIPIQAVLRNIFASYFVAGQKGIGSSLHFGLSNAPKVIAIGAVAGATLIMGSKAFGLILGSGFSSAAPILRWLAGVAMLQGIQYLLADILTGSDHQLWRSLIGACSAIMYIATLVILSLDGIAGIVLAIYLNQTVTIIVYVIAIAIVSKRQMAQRPAG
jgi:O-antigen/teichoic acid export membrane protein